MEIDFFEHQPLREIIYILRVGLRYIATKTALYLYITTGEIGDQKGPALCVMVATIQFGSVYSI